MAVKKQTAVSAIKTPGEVAAAMARIEAIALTAAKDGVTLRGYYDDIEAQLETALREVAEVKESTAQRLADLTTEHMTELATLRADHAARVATLEEQVRSLRHKLGRVATELRD